MTKLSGPAFPSTVSCTAEGSVGFLNEPLRADTDYFYSGLLEVDYAKIHLKNPNIEEHGDLESAIEISLMDDFAKTALTSIISAMVNTSFFDAIAKNASESGVTVKDQAAIAAYEYATSMMTARKLAIKKILKEKQ